jgi:hypothetical protein
MTVGADQAQLDYLSGERESTAIGGAGRTEAPLSLKRTRSSLNVHGRPKADDTVATVLIMSSETSCATVGDIASTASPSP